MKKILLLCMAASAVLTASAQRRYLGREHKKDEPTVYIISVKESDTIWSNNPALAQQHIAAQRSAAAKEAVADHTQATRKGFQQVDSPNVVFANHQNSFSFAIGGYVALRASYSFNDAVDNIDMVPYDIPIASNFASRQALGMDATTSRLYLRAIANPKRLKNPVIIYFDADFRGGSRGSYTPRLRSGYVSVAGFTFGRDVTTFCDITAAPTTIDFQGPNAYNFNFATMIRYELPFLNNHMKFGVAAEMPTVVMATLSNLFRSVFPISLSICRLCGVKTERATLEHLLCSVICTSITMQDRPLQTSLAGVFRQVVIYI